MADELIKKLLRREVGWIGSPESETLHGSWYKNTKRPDLFSAAFQFSIPPLKTKWRQYASYNSLHSIRREWNLEFAYNYRVPSVIRIQSGIPPIDLGI